jgi:peptide-methionine (S)-S-oxide reductase
VLLNFPQTLQTRVLLGSTVITGYVLSMSKSHQRAVFGASCYWGSETAFRAVPGVVDTAVGFMGDSLCCADVPSSDDEAKDMCMVEVVQVEFDAEQISYAELVETFWCCHDATRNVHRPEDGRPSLERSVLFVCDDEQRTVAEELRVAARKSDRFAAPVTTTIEPMSHFHRADEEEQKYFERNEGVVCSAKLPVVDADAAE